MKKRTMRKIFLIFLTLATVGIVAWGSHWVMTPSPEKVAKKVDELKTKEYAKTQQPAPATTSQLVEALVLENECITPCSGNIPVGKFKVRTDGHPIRIKYKGVDNWFVEPPGEDSSAPKGVEAGEAQFVSSDKNNLHIKVQVYKKITVPMGR